MAEAGTMTVMEMRHTTGQSTMRITYILVIIMIFVSIGTGTGFTDDNRSAVLKSNPAPIPDMERLQLNAQAALEESKAFCDPHKSINEDRKVADQDKDQSPFAQIEELTKKESAVRILHQAIRENKRSDVCVMLQLGLNPNTIIDKQVTAIGIAAVKGSDFITALLLNFGADPNPDIRDSIATPLIVSAYQGNAIVGKLLVDHGADVNASGALGNDAITAAAMEGHVEFIRVLLEAGANMEKHRLDQWSALQTAVVYDQEDAVALLLSYGAPVNIQDKFKKTPLMSAARKGNMKIAALLIACGADLSFRNSEGETALSIARKYKNEEMATFLAAISTGSRNVTVACPSR